MTTEQPQVVYVEREREPRNGLGLAALIVACVGVLFGLMPITGWIAVPCAITAFFLGLAARGRVKAGKATNRKTATTAVIVSVLAFALGVWGIVLFFQTVDDLGNDLDCIGKADTAKQMDKCGE